MRRIFPSTILYFHRISDNRMTGAPLKSFHVSSKIIGENFKERTIIVTTMWDKMVNRIEFAKARETELREMYWKSLVGTSSHDQRFDNSGLSANRILSLAMHQTVSPSGKPLLHQEELVDQGLQLGETQAGQTLYNDLSLHIFRQIQIVNSMKHRIKDSTLSAELSKEKKRLQDQLNTCLQQAEELELKVPFGKRVFRFFREKGYVQGNHF